MIAALFVHPFGIYALLDGVDVWGLPRDARTYNGPHPVVCHPPCHLWGKFAKINYIRWGGDHNRPGNDNGCFESALISVDRYGGVLEHPADSHAWDAFGIKKPESPGWEFIGHDRFVCEVWQSAYGHKATKRTIILYKGLHPPYNLRWERPRGEFQIGFHDQRGKSRNKKTIAGHRASATPYEFARELVSLSRHSMGCRR